MIGNEFFTGLNYWDTKSAINMWSNFDKESIENDFKLMKGAGITHLRVFSLWPVFQPLHALYEANGVYEYTFGEESLPDTDAGRAGVGEEACQNFEIFCEFLLDKTGDKWYHNRARVGTFCACTAMMQEIARKRGNFCGVCPVIGRLNCFC